MTDPYLENYLAHYGVKGMRWGKRKNPNYADNQVKRDIQVYGKRGAKRINKSLNDGNSISVARGDEKTRRDGVMSKNKYVRQGGKAAGAVAAGAVGFVAVQAVRKAASSRAGREFLFKNLPDPAWATPIHQTLRHPATTALITAGAAKVGHMLAGDIAVNTRMRAHGYDPNRK